MPNETRSWIAVAALCGGVLCAVGCGGARREPSLAEATAPTHLSLPRLEATLALPPIPISAPEALVEEARAVEQLLAERAPVLTLGGSEESTQQSALELFRWYTERAAMLPRPWPDACRGCSAREGAYFVAIGAVAHDHLLGQFVSPRLARADGGAITDALRREVWSLLARGVPETAIGNAVLALDRCQTQARGLEGLQRIASTCNLAQLRWTALHQRRSQASDGSGAVDADAPHGPRECWTTPQRTERSTASAGPSTPPAVVVTFGESSTVLDESERRTLRRRVATWARTHVLPASGGTLVADDVQVEWERLGRVGRVATEPACAHGTIGLDSLDDAAPVVLALVIDADCGDTECSLRVTPTLSVGALPEVLRVSFRADVARTEAVVIERWVAAVDALQQEPRLGGILVASPPMSRPFEASVRGLVPNDSLRDAVQSTITAHTSIGACVTDVRRRVIRATVRWDERGGVEDVAIAPWAEASEGSACASQPPCAPCPGSKE